MEKSCDDVEPTVDVATISKPNFSIVIIARNEEERIARNLSQAGIKAFMQDGGDVVIADTGSTDNTMAMAETLGARAVSLGKKHLHTLSKRMAKMINDMFVVSPEPPIVTAGETYFDFGSARNDAHKHALHDMVLQIDMCDMLEVLDWRKLSAFIASGVTRFTYCHYLGPGTERQTIARFYDRRIDTWKGISHEAIGWNLKPAGYVGVNGEDQGGQMQQGITVSTKMLQVRYLRNIKKSRPYSIGMAIDIMKNPNDPRWLHYMGREMTPTYTNRPRSAIVLLEKQGDMENAWTPERSSSLTMAGLCYEALLFRHYDKRCAANECWDTYSKDMLDKAMHSYWKAQYIDPSRREPFIRLADLHRKLAIRTKNHDKLQHHWRSILCFATAALQIPNTTLLSEDEGNYREYPHDHAAYALSWLGRWSEAKYHHQKCLEYAPWCARYRDESKLYEKHLAKEPECTAEEGSVPTENEK